MVVIFSKCLPLGSHSRTKVTLTSTHDCPGKKLKPFKARSLRLYFCLRITRCSVLFSIDVSTDLVFLTHHILACVVMLYWLRLLPAFYISKDSVKAQCLPTTLADPGACGGVHTAHWFFPFTSKLSGNSYQKLFLQSMSACENWDDVASTCVSLVSNT